MGVENDQKTPPKWGGRKHPKKGHFDPPPGGWRYTKQCKFWRDSSVLIQGVRRFFALRRVIFGSFFDPHKRTPPGWQTWRTTPKMGVSDPPIPEGCFRQGLQSSLGPCWTMPKTYISSTPVVYTTINSMGASAHVHHSARSGTRTRRIIREHTLLQVTDVPRGSPRSNFESTPPLYPYE